MVTTLARRRPESRRWSCKTGRLIPRRQQLEHRYRHTLAKMRIVLEGRRDKNLLLPSNGAARR